MERTHKENTQFFLLHSSNILSNVERLRAVMAKIPLKESMSNGSKNLALEIRRLERIVKSHDN